MSEFKGHMILNDAYGNVGSVRPISFMENGTVGAPTVSQGALAVNGGHPAYLFSFSPYPGRWSPPAPQMVAPAPIPAAPQQQQFVQQQLAQQQFQVPFQPIPPAAPPQQQVISQQVQRMQNGLPGVQPVQVPFPQQLGPALQQPLPQQQFNGQLLSQPQLQLGQGVFEGQLIVQQ